MSKVDKGTAKSGGGVSGRVSVCDGQYDVLSDMRLEQYDQPGGKAYVVQTGRGAASNKFAVVCNPGVLPRLELFESAATIKNHHVMQFVSGDVAFWPEHDRSVPVLVYEKPGGAPLFQSMDEERPPMKNEVAFRQSVECLVDGLRDIAFAGCSHGRINVLNLYTLDAMGAQLQFGDFLSVLPGVGQHPAFETAERLMSSPVGRGPTTLADEIYACGVCLLMILVGRLPIVDMGEEEVLRLKLERGSLMTLLHGMRLPSAYSELMRGMLNDDQEQRWSLDDIAHWLSGRRLGSKPATRIRRAQRGLTFAGVGYFNPRTLAHAMSKNPAEAVKIVEDSSLERWVHRSLGDEERSALVAEAVTRAGQITRGGTPAERIVGRVIMALDPYAPVRFRDVFAMPNGIGTLFASRMMRGGSPTNIADFIAGQYLSYWANLAENLSADNFAVAQIFDGMRVLMERTNYGFGIERVLYELNPAMPCISPLIEKHYALSMRALMQALEIEAGREIEHGGGEKREPIDRHIAGFILARNRRINDRFFPLLTTKGEPGRRAHAILNIYAELQRKFYPDELPNLASWLVKLLDPVLQRYHNRSLRTQVARDLLRLSRRGDLKAMADLIDDGNLRKEDEDGFAQARRQYWHLEGAIKDLSEGGERERKLLRQGQQITAFVVCLLSFVLVCLIVFWMLL